MEEEKAAAYYDELTRKGEGAARFKQGLGFSSATNYSAPPPPRGSALSTSSSSLSSFVRASSPTQASKLEKQAQLEAIQNKLKKKPKDDNSERSSRVSERSNREERQRNQSRSRERERDRERRYRSRSRDKERERDRDRVSSRSRRRRSRSRSVSPRRDRRMERRRSRSRSVSPRRDRRVKRRRSRSRSSSPRERRRSDKRSDIMEKERRAKETKTSSDYSRLIPGYDKMTAAERVNARMRFQLDETAEKDTKKGTGAGWERFEFNKDAPLDDEEIEAADDDAAIVKHLGQSFRFSAVVARREEQIKAAHDEAIFGPTVQRAPSPEREPEVGGNEKNISDAVATSSLLSEKVQAKQQGSWRDRARRS